jgi:ribosomal protein S18 acetylase RimI-like enzyme
LARPEELATVVRLIVTSPNGQFEEAHAREFLRLADSHRGDAGGAWIAYQGAVPLGGALAVASPGKTMLVFTPSYLPTATHKRLTVGAIEGLCEGAIAAGIHLAQSLIDPDDKSLQALFEQCGFSPLAELHYLQSSGSKRAKEATLPPGLRWVTYSEERHELFAQAIVATYQNSLDCPGLNGLRDVRDVIEGHRATGEFDPSLWFVLLNGETPLGVLLLSRVQRGEMMELVYLGLTPTARGQGLGDLLMRQALSMTVAHRQARMSLAVDAANVPALRLYWRHGLQVIGRKRAMLRDLRRPIVHANISEVHADSA